MNLVFILGKMEECMMDFIWMIKNMDTVYTLGLTKRNMLVGGIKVNSTG